MGGHFLIAQSLLLGSACHDGMGVFEVGSGQLSLGLSQTSVVVILHLLQDGVLSLLDLYLLSQRLPLAIDVLHLLYFPPGQ